MGNMTTENDTIGKRLRIIRNDNHMNQAEFVEKIGISVNFLSDLENDKRRMSIETLIKICQTFNASSDFILLGKNEQPSDKEILQLVLERANECSVDQLDTIQAYLRELKKIKVRLEK